MRLFQNKVVSQVMVCRLNFNIHYHSLQSMFPAGHANPIFTASRPSKAGGGAHKAPMAKSTKSSMYTSP